MSAVSEVAADVDRLGIGANGPPEPSPFEAVKVNMEDYLLEARNWADGVAVETQEQADKVSKLIEDLRLSAEAADGVRKQEKAPLDVKIAEIQDRYNVYIAPMTNKKPGSVPKAIDALKAVLKPFLDKLEEVRKAEAEKARKEAQEAEDKAREAIKSASGNIEAQEVAEALAEAADEAARQARNIENSRSQARGGSRAMGLKKTFTPVMIDRKAALYHYIAINPDAFERLLQDLAETDVREGKRQIPGFRVDEGTKL